MIVNDVSWFKHANAERPNTVTMDTSAKAGNNWKKQTNKQKCFHKCVGIRQELCEGGDHCTQIWQKQVSMNHTNAQSSFPSTAKTWLMLKDSVNKHLSG